MITTDQHVTYHVRVVGYIWQPGVGLCAMDYTFGCGPYAGSVDVPGYGGNELEAVEQCLLSNAGDFQAVVDWQCDRQVDEWTYSDGQRRKATTWATIRDWAEAEHELAYSDIMGQDDE